MYVEWMLLGEKEAGERERDRQTGRQTDRHKYRHRKTETI